ncbi:hypothetical protein SLA2020_359930 [Shorea laevis]
MKSSASPVFLFAFCHIFCLAFGTDVKPLAPALYVFGDSLFDSGNNNFLPTLAKANYLPYGSNFDKGITGRFTNGRTLPDFVAEFLGLPYAPPYLSVRVSATLTVTGFNYASGTCGILPETGSLFGKCLNLGDQINLFERTVKSELPRQFGGSRELSEYLSKSIFLVSIGNNDYLNNYQNSSNQRDPQQFAQVLTDALSHHFEKLYNLGARKVVMFEIGPIGCIPWVAKTHEHTGQCFEETNMLASYFNNRLPAVLNNLTSTLQGSIFVLGHANWLGYDAVLHPSKYGLKDSINPCCTTWGNGASMCVPFLKPCPNPEKHYFWDAFHLTEAVYSVIASRCINDTTVCLPFNIKDLVEK